MALMFLKSYTGLSDDGLIELLNGSIHMQLFCGVLIDPQNPIKNGKIVSAIRNRLARCLNIKDLQAVLYDKWAPMLANKDLCLTDATCYESHLRFPTDVKLLWESCAWLHTLLSKARKELGERKPRNKYADIDRARLVYAKQRKHTHKATQKLRRGLLNLLCKLICQWNNLCRQYTTSICLNAEQSKRIAAINEVRRQQQDLMKKKCAAPHCQHRPPILASHCPWKGEPECRVRCQGQQHSNRWHILYRTPLVRSFQRRCSIEGMY